MRPGPRCTRILAGARARRARRLADVRRRPAANRLGDRRKPCSTGTTPATLELKWKIRLDNAPKELTSLTAPIVVDQVKTVRGIKEYVVVAGSSDTIFAIDADTGKLAWQKTFEAGRRAGAQAQQRSAPSRSMPLQRSSPTGRPKTVYAISSDGRLHALSMVDGEDRFPPLPFVPALLEELEPQHRRRAALHRHRAAMQRRAVGRVFDRPELARSTRSVRFKAARPESGAAPESPFHRRAPYSAKPAMGPMIPRSGQFADTIFALSADLKLADYYTPANREWLTRKDLDMGASVPWCFRYGARSTSWAPAKRAGCFCLITESLGGDDHRTPLYRSELITNEDVAYAAHGFWGSFATWEDSQGVRWLFAPAWGPPHPEARPFPVDQRRRAARQHHGFPCRNAGRRAGAVAGLDLARPQRARASDHRQRRRVRAFQRRGRPPGRCRGKRHEY